MTKCAIYVRVSTTEQNASNQLDVLTEWAARRGFDVAAVYQEEESAWKAGHQHELARAIKAAKAGRFKVLLVWSLDRLSREGSLAVLTLVNRLGSYGVRIFSYQEPWTEAPGELAEILYAIVGWVARNESKRISERTRAGLARAARQGRYPGRPKGSKDKRRRKKRAVRVPAWAEF